VKQTIAHNAEILRRLHDAIHTTFAHRSESPEAMVAWKQACGEFHSRYDALAFPGGLSVALERLARGDMVTAETAIAYLELHPYFFRSQYNATAFIRRLKKLELRRDLQKRFDAVLAASAQRKRQKTPNI
jgi:hypothetical protein